MTSRRGEDSGGAAHIGDSELSSGLYYGYVVVNIPQLMENCGLDFSTADADERHIPALVVRNLVHLISTVTPASKLRLHGGLGLRRLRAGSRRAHGSPAAWPTPSARRSPHR